jgi:phospholipid-translocating ATPase
MFQRFQEIFEPKYFDPYPSFIDISLPLHLKENGLQAIKIREFFSLLAVCHTVLVEKSHDSDSNIIAYRAQSPDEAALVSAAKNVGFTCLDRTENKVEIDLFGIQRTYTVLNILEFNSDRKRMSLIVKRPEGEILLLCKGADSVIYERLDKEKITNIAEQTSEHLESFANQGESIIIVGLRTLCLAFRMISQEEYNNWLPIYRRAQSNMENREKECDIAAEMIEKNLTLMGATAIEDKLQDSVPETIEILAKAGIKIWVLTV